VYCSLVTSRVGVSSLPADLFLFFGLADPGEARSMRGWAGRYSGSLHGEGEREGGRKEFRKPFSFRRAELAERIAEIFSRSKRRMGEGFVWAASRSLAAHREQPREWMGILASGHTLGAELRCHQLV